MPLKQVQVRVPRIATAREEVQEGHGIRGHASRFQLDYGRGS